VAARGAAGSRRVKSAQPDENDRAGQNDAAGSRCAPRFLCAPGLCPEGCLWFARLGRAA